MSRTIYGICVNDIDINQRKLLNLMKETLPDFHLTENLYTMITLRYVIQKVCLSARKNG